jgi:hypothetical protein
VSKLNRAVRAALADATVKQRYVDMGQELPPPEEQTPEALAAYSEGRDRKMVAHHKGGEHQSGMRPLFTAPIFHDLRFANGGNDRQ